MFFGRRHTSKLHLLLSRVVSFLGYTIELADSQPRNLIPPLDRLPIELLEEIFFQACADGGLTACALSLVSKRIHVVSRAARFHSVSLLTGSRWKVRRLLQGLSEACKQAREQGTTTPRIRHLCLNMMPTVDGYGLLIKSTPFDLACWGHVEDLMAQMNTLPRKGRRERRREFKSELTYEYHDAVQDLLRTTSPDLETLCLYGGRWARVARGPVPTSPSLVCEGFPRLRELSFGGDEPVFSLPDQLAGRPRPLFPALSRLSIAAHSNNALDFEYWFGHAPVLKDFRFHFRFTNPYGRPKWADSLELTLRNLGESNRSSSPAIQILVDPETLESIGDQVTRHHAETLSPLGDLMKQTRSPALLVMNYDARQEIDDKLTDLYSASELLRLDWLSRISSCDGIFTPHAWSRPRKSSGNVGYRLSRQRSQRRKGVPHFLLLQQSERTRIVSHNN